MENKKKNTGLFILIAILCVLALLLGGYIIYNKTQNNNNIPNINTPATKLDDTKDWVYDAEYKKDVKVESYKHFDNEYNANNINVPFINVNSTYANNSNIEIKKVLDRAINDYNEGIENKMIYLDECRYVKHISNDIISVLLIYGTGGPDIIQPEYYTYNIDLKTGNKLSYEKAYTIAGFNSKNINSKVENEITKQLKSYIKDILDNPDTYEEAKNFDSYNKKSIANYNTSIKDKTIKYFITNDGKLNVIVKLVMPIGNGEFDTILTIN